MKVRLNTEFAPFQTIVSPIGVAWLLVFFTEYTKSVPSTFMFKGFMEKYNVL